VVQGRAGGNAHLESCCLPLKLYRRDAEKKQSKINRQGAKKFNNKYEPPSAPSTPRNTNKSNIYECFIGAHLRLSRSNVRIPGVSWTVHHQEVAEVIGTGFICGSIDLFFLAVLAILACLAVRCLFVSLGVSAVNP
jgi:hypothetical protein